MKTKFLIPVLAAIFAIGMSFTPINSALDYVQLQDGSWEPIEEVNCGLDLNIKCRVQFGVGGPTYQVYDEMNLSTAKEGDRQDPIIINP